MTNGNDCVLSWNGEVVACLTSNSLSEVLSFLQTSKKTINGAQTSIPVANSYQINFEAVMVSDLGMSWNDLSLRLLRWQKYGLSRYVKYLSKLYK